jgi:hypothetical protein
VIAQAFIFLLLHYYTLLTESAYVDVLLYSGIFEIERIFNAEQDRVNDAERNAIIQARDEQYVKHLAGRLLSGGVPLVELTILEPVADLLVDYAYSCRMAGVPESERYLVEKKASFQVLF